MLIFEEERLVASGRAKSEEGEGEKVVADWLRLEVEELEELEKTLETHLTPGIKTGTL